MANDNRDSLPRRVASAVLFVAVRVLALALIPVAVAILVAFAITDAVTIKCRQRWGEREGRHE